MSEQLFSPSWYRVSKLRPRLRGHVQIHRHDYRGEIWYVLQDHAKNQYYRFTPSAYQLIGRMDGKRSVQELWEESADRLGDDGPTQGETVQLLSQLHAADALLCDVPPDTAELLRRSERIATSKRRNRFRTPLFVRLPLLDPDRFLNWTVGLFRPLFSVFGALVWLAVVVAATVTVATHWPELTEGFVDRILSAQNLLILALAFPLVKAVHEFGHAYAVKAWGGEVHEMGIMLLVFMPIPYVEASAVSEFRARHRRVLVGAAGMIVELFLASLAVFLWVSLQPGILRSFAYNVIVIGSVSTILFNANPLLRFDGYYILSDLIEIPNLGQRGIAYVKYLTQRYLLGMDKTRRPHTGPGEPSWFVTYTASAFVYRIFLYASIFFVVAGKFFTIGMLLAMWAAVGMIGVPVAKGAKFVATDPQLRERRGRALLATAAVAAVVGSLLFALPLPLRSRAEGVVWAPDESLVRAGTSGFIHRVVAEPRTVVSRGDVLIECRDPLITARVRVLEARLDELTARYDAAMTLDRVQAQILAEEIASARGQVERERERLDELDIRSPGDGLFVLPAEDDLEGRYLRQGELVAYVLDIERPTVRAVVPQSRVGLVRQQTEAVEVRMVERLERVLPATVRREVPGAASQLPSPALARGGGGAIVTDPFDPAGNRALEGMFQFDLELEHPLDEVFVGSRVYVRFDHGSEAPAFQVYRQLRQLFLRRFNV